MCDVVRMALLSLFPPRQHPTLFQHIYGRDVLKVVKLVAGGLDMLRATLGRYQLFANNS